MKFSENWLRDLVDIPATRDELTHRLTMCGLEVESVESLGADLTGVLIGEIVEAVASGDSTSTEDRIRGDVQALTAQFPIYGGTGG